MLRLPLAPIMITFFILLIILSLTFLPFITAQLYFATVQDSALPVPELLKMLYQFH